MENSEKPNRPERPFLDENGQPRMRSRLSAAGPIEYRPAELIVDLREIEGAREDPSLVIKTIGEFVGGVSIDERDLKQAEVSGYLRVRLGDSLTDPLELAERLNAKLGSTVASVNAVFKIGALTADPMKLSGGAFGADPMKLSADYGDDPFIFMNSSTAKPAFLTGQASQAQQRQACGSNGATVAILDTGIPIDGIPKPSDVDFRGLGDGIRDRPDVNADGFLDIAAGHSTFIRTIIERSSPTVEFIVEGVMHNDGDGDEVEIAEALLRVFEAVKDKSRLILNLSFSGYYTDDVEPPLVALWIRKFVDAGAVVVAAAGNDGHCRPKYPGAMPEVLSVGAIGPCGPAPFSNHGPWVNACAPGEDLVSEFFDHFDGAFEPVVATTVPDIDHFSGWAMWSGTSFSTPAVVGALCEIIELHGCTAVDAVQRLVETPGLFRLPDYGVVVNRIF